MMKRKRYAVCGVSARAIAMFIRTACNTYSDAAEIVALLDIDPLRFKVCKEEVPQCAGLPEYMPEEFDKMVEETHPDVIIAAGVDRTHVIYTVKALEHDLDVISEKPMTTTVADCLKVMEAEKKSKGKVICSFNYRYTPTHRKIREMIMEGKLGRITNIDLNWYVDIQHGASYFKRWNRLRENSGGLSIHKASHHFDLVNWWIDGIPVEVHAFGDLNYYGPEGITNPRKAEGRHCGACPDRAACAYVRRWSKRAGSLTFTDEHLNAFNETKTQKYSKYRPDCCIFDSEINIEDTYVVNVRYANRALLNYSVNFSCPYEGYSLAINGTKGRLETREWHAPARTPFPIGEGQTQYIDYFPLFGSRERLWTIPGSGGHGGGDSLILDDIFLGPDPLREYDILATSDKFLHAVEIGESVWRSIKEDRVIRMEEYFNK